MTRIQTSKVEDGMETAHLLAWSLGSKGSRTQPPPHPPHRAPGSTSSMAPLFRRDCIFVHSAVHLEVFLQRNEKPEEKPRKEVSNLS